MEPKPELEATYAHIKSESNRQGTMSEADITNEAAALAVARMGSQRHKRDSNRASFASSQSSHETTLETPSIQLTPRLWPPQSENEPICTIINAREKEKEKDVETYHPVTFGNE
ncbi:hypothetical protein SADUNF_Sadunf05G0102100 [Salix dunnii]|uniref:Uncharacterized protein n=1 Tax=Salix dunnii TaxID=1413687 RepID=A0A835N262_9ROSI|nr:hypothetical protein SADUNF_Sadunf05G0102100 [Salix dunnii]